MTANRTLRNRLFIFSVIVSLFGYLFGILFCVTDPVHSGTVYSLFNDWIEQNRIIGSLVTGPIPVILVFLFGFSFLGAGGTVSILYYYSFATSLLSSEILIGQGISGIFSVILKLFPTAGSVIVILCLTATDSFEYSFTARRKSEKEFISDTVSYTQSCFFMTVISLIAFIWSWKIIPLFKSFI